MIKLYVNNFRGFLNQEIELPKISILIGENCSGKSSLIKLLLAMKQSLLPSQDQNSNFTLSGEYSDLGNYHETVYNHQITRKISFKFSLSKEYEKFYLREIPDVAIALMSDEMPRPGRILRRNLQQTSLNYLKKFIKSETTVEYQINNELDNHSKVKTIFFNKKIGEAKLRFPEKIEKKSEEYVYFQSSCDIIFKQFPSERTYVIKDVLYDQSGFMTIIYAQSLKQSIDRDLAEIPPESKEELFYHLSYLFITQNYISNYLKTIEYINPIASQPERIYFKGDYRKRYTVNNIEKVIKMLDKKEDSDFIESFSQLISQFGIADDILLKSSNDLPVQELRIKINDLWSNIADVGYGVALQLPIIFEALYSEIVTKEKKVLLIEQPEVHVHPRLQARLIEVLCSLSHKTSYIIETHSEHIVRKLQTIVKNSQFEIKPDDISITYFTKKNKQLIMQKHNINPNGILYPSIPSGFFDSTYILAKELLK
jgi:predicted ATPase